VNTRRDYSRFGKTLLAAATLSALLLFIAVPPLQADGRAKCQRNIERAEAMLQNAIKGMAETVELPSTDGTN